MPRLLANLMESVTAHVTEREMESVMDWRKASMMDGVTVSVLENAMVRT